MTCYIACIELENNKNEVKLSVIMARFNFFKQLTSVDGKNYDLPFGVYCCEKPLKPLSDITQDIKLSIETQMKCSESLIFLCSIDEWSSFLYRSE